MERNPHLSRNIEARGIDLPPEEEVDIKAELTTTADPESDPNLINRENQEKARQTVGEIVKNALTRRKESPEKIAYWSQVIAERMPMQVLARVRQLESQNGVNQDYIFREIGPDISEVIRVVNAENATNQKPKPAQRKSA